MWHLPFLFLFIAWIQPWLSGWSPEQAYGIYWLWVMLVIIPFCFLFFKWVEQPGMRLGERFRKPEISPVVPAQAVLAVPLHEKERVESKS
jgi:peptidoglycan/LPS O-acetylase OafA/YrhL